ncbi:peptidylprolyl isomerase [uncultured Azonexus sp.]|uniref:peptidylprolyl isomerase n=1 Tax=uncultured Azonexus sp. TaxID=520307 RepID=UPI0026399BEB|nr:peptidylprolyl isomerase [uncultured Azonexus sp.]
MKKLIGIIAALTLSSASAWAAPTLELQTSMGRIVVELDAEKAPKSAANFLQYARDGFYNGTVFHRVIPGFMIQGGGFDASMNKKSTREPIENEAKNGLKNRRGTIAMARTMDPHSATAQFFINHNDNLPLDYPSRDGWGYAVFGKVTEGMDVVDKIAKVPTANVGMHGDVPRTPVVIQNVRIISEK